MNIEQVQDLIQGIFDQLFAATTSAEPGGQPIMPAESTMLSLMKPGLAINPDDFKNPWTPGNQSGSQDAAVNLARLVDVAPGMSAIYEDRGHRISQIYKQIRDGVSIPAQKPNPAIEKQLSEADAVLYRSVDDIDPETGDKTKRKVLTQLYREYRENQATYNAARLAYMGAYLEAQKTESGRNTWPLISTTLQIPVRQAHDYWRGAGADKVEQALAILATSSENALQKAWYEAQTLFRGYGVNLDESGTGLSVPIQRVSVLPSNWYSPGSTGWPIITIGTRDVSRSNSSDYKTFGGKAGFGLGLFSIGGSAGRTVQNHHASAETNDLKVSFGYTMVSIHRPWLTYNLLGTSGWNLSNLYRKGKVSNGTKSGQETAAMPLLPTSFVVAKDIVISASWSKADLDFIKKHVKGGGGLSIGPFSIGGTYARSSSKKTYEATITGGTIEVPGVQIIGTISQVVPLCPPA